MPSDKHQLILRLVVQRMVVDGFQLTHWDGTAAKSIGGGSILLPSPPTLGSHRPDALAFHKRRKVWGIAEAKTASDLLSDRTKRQMKDFSNTRMLSSKEACDLYLGVPEDAIHIARELLVNCRLHGKHNIHLLAFPLILLK